MSNEIDIAQAKRFLEEGKATFVDIRDPDSFRSGHIPGAYHVHDGNAGLLSAVADKEQALIIYCYKGNASRAAADHFGGKGFKAVSLSGGFNAWDGPSNNEPVTGDAPAGLEVTDAAKEKLAGYLKGEGDATRVRITLDGGPSFGLALDEPLASDLTFEASGLRFTVDRLLAPCCAGLKIDFTEAVSGAGFKLEGGSAPQPPGTEDLKADIQQRIAENRIMVFMKGTAAQPMCGFSARTVEILRRIGKPFGDKNVLEDPQYRYVLSEVSEWPTIPQVFIGGEFVGGCDIVTELEKSGELAKLVEAAFAGVEA